MSATTLKFNILNFSHPQKEYNFWFTNQNIEGLNRVFNSLVPEELINHFGEQEHYYTSFVEQIEGAISVKIDIQNSSLLKRYYSKIIGQYFTAKGLLVKPDFIADNEIWVKSKKSSPDYVFYEKFNIRVQFEHITAYPELLISYEGCSKVFKKSVASLLDEIPLECFKTVIYKNQFFRYEQIPDEVVENLEQCFPAWNFDIRAALHQQTEAPDRNNRYVKYNESITLFIETFLNTEDFKRIIPLLSTEFVSVKDIRIGNVSPTSNQLSFGNDNKGFVPKYDIKNHGPYKISPYRNIQFFFIFHESDQSATFKIDRFFKGQESGFNGLRNFIKIPYQTENNFSIRFKNKENPLPEIEAELYKRSFNPDIKYIAVYISPYNKHVTEKAQNSIYYKLKELLLKRGITSQTLEAEKIMTQKGYHYSLPNIAIAILAKLNGTPWRLNNQLKNELVVGVGAFYNSDTGVKYIGSAFSFSNNGKFNKFECFYANETELLAGSIIMAVKEFVAINSDIQRLIIHYYKTISEKEIDPIEKGLKNLGLSIPVFIVSINKTESSDIVAFDYSWKELMPSSGTFINIGRNKFLLFNNTRYEGGAFSASDGYPFPIKMHMFCTDREQLKDNKTMCELIDQVYQFSRMYWKSVRQQNLPVTIKYPEMVAEMVPHFEGYEIPEYGKDKLWFL